MSCDSIVSKQVIKINIWKERLWLQILKEIFCTCFPDSLPCPPSLAREGGIKRGVSPQKTNTHASPTLQF